MKNRPPRKLVLLLVAQLVLAACSATAHTPLPASTWPEPQPTQWPAPGHVARTVPGFHAPSAPHCARPVQTRELPGGQGEQSAYRRDMRDRFAGSAPSRWLSAPSKSANRKR